MNFLLDTNIVSHNMRGAPGLAHRFIPHTGRLSIPTLVLGELYAGAFLRSDPDPLLRQIADLLAFVDVVDFDRSCAHTFGTLRGELKRRGLAAQPVDLLIAAVAVAHDLTLVTHNTAHFAHIPEIANRRLGRSVSQPRKQRHGVSPTPEPSQPAPYRG